MAGLLDEDALRFLEDVASHADDGVRDRYHRLGLSGAKGHGAKLALIAGAWLEQQFIRLGNTRKAVLRPMPIARELLGLAKQAGGEGSVAHEYWRRWYARTLEAHGHHVRIEQPRLGGRIDVLARHGDRLLAVEIETGKSDVVKNVRGCLLAGIVHVLVVATDKPAFTIVERRLAAAGLLVPQRVAVVLAPAMPPTAWGSAPGSDGNAARECLDLEDQPAGSGERLDSHETGRFLMDGRDKPSSSDGRVARERRP